VVIPTPGVSAPSTPPAPAWPNSSARA